jgi:hypothetical protein
MAPNARCQTPAAELVCWPFLEGRRCVRHADLAAASGYQVVVVPIATTAKQQQQQQQQQQAAAAASADPSPSDNTQQQQLQQAQQRAPSSCSINAYARSVLAHLPASLPAVLDDAPTKTPGAKP